MIDYIDFDGVIYDTERELFRDYKRLKDLGILVDKNEYIQTLNWYQHILEARPNKGSLEWLKEHKDAIILTKVNSIENEAYAKERILFENDVHNKIIFVPMNKKKSEIVDAFGNRLVDDTVHNDYDWEQEGGIPIYYNAYGNPIDPWGKDVRDFGYTRIKSLYQLDKHR